MKKILLLITVLYSLVCYSQSDSVQAPYKRFPTLPPLKILLTDSSNYFTKNDFKKNSNVMIMLFSPDCEHCQHETEELLKNIDEFKNIQIIMATMLPFADMKNFYEKYELSKYKNIVVGQDQNFFLIPFYAVRNLPFLAFYNKKGNLISILEGSVPIRNALAEFEK
jgi:thioredoxin-related protein